MYLSFFASMVLAASRAANAAPSGHESLNGTLAPARWVNGLPVEEAVQQNATSSTIALSGGCAPDDDVYTCAKKIAPSLHAPGKEYLTEQKSLKLPLRPGESSWYPSAAYFTFGYRNAYRSCSVSPTIVHKDNLFFCNAETCSESFTFSRSTTNTSNYGFSIGTSVSAEGNIGFVTASVTVSADFTEGWSKAVTETSEFTRTYNMKQGQLCAPTTVQLKLNCDSHIVTEPHDTAYYYDKSGKLLGSSPLCNTLTPKVPAIEKICAAITEGSPVRIDVAGSDALDHKPWAIDGCMYN